MVDRGLFQDCTEMSQPQGTYRFAKNIIDTRLLGVKENEDGFTDLESTTPYTLIGVIPVDQNNVVVFSTDNTDSEIGLVDLDTGDYTEIYNDPDLAFSTTSPIKGEYRKDIDGDRIVVFHDTINTLRIINIDDLSGINDVEDLNAFQDVINPSISDYSISNFGGSLLTGAYIPITKYKNQDGSETNWFVHDHTFYINDDATSLAFNEDDGASPGTVSNKIANFTLFECDLRYDTIVVGYIRTINNITTAYQVTERSNATSLDISITGNESTTDISLDEVLTPNANYNTVGSITQLAGQLYVANVTTESIPELQPYALDVRIDYTHELINVISNTDSHKDSLPPSFMPGEVYAFYLGVELNKGGWCFYHIAGRDAASAFPAETTTITSEGMTYPKYQVNDTSDNSFATTNMGFWQNSNELYPSDTQFNAASIGGRDLRNQEVLHHRFPTLDHLIDEYYTGDSSVGVTHLIRLGIDVSNVIIPTDIQSKIKRWKIFFAKKAINNSIVVGSDLLQFGVSTATDSDIRWSTGGNWDIEAESATPGEWENFVMTDFDTIRGHSLDLQQSSITPTYALFNYALQRENLNTQYSGFRSAGARMTICGEDRGQIASAVIDYTVSAQTTRTDTSFFKRLDNFSYLPPNALNGKFKSQYNEGGFVADIHTPSNDFDFLTILRLYTRSSGEPAESNQFTFAPTYSGILGEHTMHMQYCRLLSDVHTSFMQQDLIPMEDYGEPTDTIGTFYGGDTYMCYLSYLTAAPQNANPDSTIGAPYEQGVRMWKAYISYSKFNFNYRYQTQGDISTYFHGKTDVRTLFSPTVTDTTPNYTTLVHTNDSLNVLNYDTSMNSSNIYNVGVIFNPDIIEATEFPNTIIWSPVQNEESKEFSWRSFPAGNRYVIPKNKGDITNIQGVKNDTLLINTTDSFYRTRSDLKVTTDTGEVYLKTSSIFDIPPEELIPSISGAAGCQHRFGCVVTKYGYIFPDDKRGTIYLYNGQLEDISSNGNSLFFKSSMGEDEDNPFVESGYTIGFDPKLNRIIVTKKSGVISWTFSYNPIRKTWISFHDYIPDYMFNTLSGGLYSAKANGFHLHEGGAKGTYYGVQHVSYIDIVFNTDNSEHKLLYSINWNTEVYPNTYTNGQPNNELDYNTTCTQLTCHSTDHCMPRTTLVGTSSIYDFDIANIRNKKGTWYFDDIRDFATTVGGFLLTFYQNYTIDETKLNMNLDWFDQRRFIDRYVSCRFEFANTQNKRWLLKEANAEFRQVAQ